MAKETCYFSHDYDSINDPKISGLIEEIGGIAYAIFWRIVELLHIEDSHELPMKKFIYMAISKDLKIEASIVEEFIRKAISPDYELLYESNGYFYSERVKRNVDRMEKISNQRSEAVSARWSKSNKNGTKKDTFVIQQNTDVIQSDTNKNKIKEKKINTKEKEKINKKESLPPSGDGGSLSYPEELFGIFKEEYRESRGFEYLATSPKKEIALMAKIGNVYKQRRPEYDTDKAKQGLRKFFRRCLQIEDRWHYSNISPGHIVAQFNQLVAIIESKPVKNIVKPNQLIEIKESDLTEEERKAYDEQWKKQTGKHYFEQYVDTGTNGTTAQS